MTGWLYMAQENRKSYRKYSKEYYFQNRHGEKLLVTLYWLQYLPMHSEAASFLFDKNSLETQLQLACFSDTMQQKQGHQWQQLQDNQFTRFLPRCRQNHITTCITSVWTLLQILYFPEQSPGQHIHVHGSKNSTLVNTPSEHYLGKYFKSGTIRYKHVPIHPTIPSMINYSTNMMTSPQCWIPASVFTKSHQCSLQQFNFIYFKFEQRAHGHNSQ